MKNNKGFTLIEVVVVAFLAGIVGLGVIQVVARSNKVLNDSTRQSFIDYQVDFVLNDISRDIKEGYKLVLTVVPDSSIQIYKKINNVDRIVTWKTRKIDTAKDKGTYPVRINYNNSEKVYNFVGLESVYNKTLIPVFDNSTIFPGQYDGVKVRVKSTYQDKSQIMRTSAQSSVFCRIQRLAF